MSADNNNNDNDNNNNNNTNIIISGSNDRTIKIWDMASGECRRTLEGHSDWVNSVCVSADNNNRIISGSCDNTIKVWG